MNTPNMSNSQKQKNAKNVGKILHAVITFAFLLSILAIAPFMIMRWYKFTSEGPRYTLYDGIFQCEQIRRNNDSIYKTHKQFTKVLENMIRHYDIHHTQIEKEPEFARRMAEEQKSYTEVLEAIKDHQKTEEENSIDCSYLTNRVSQSMQKSFESVKDQVGYLKLLETFGVQ